MYISVRVVFNGEIYLKLMLFRGGIIIRMCISLKQYKYYNCSVIATVTIIIMYFLAVDHVWSGDLIVCQLQYVLLGVCKLIELRSFV